MSVEEKQPFLDMAETLKRQHHLDHPDYKFKPKQRSTNANKPTFKKTQSYTGFLRFSLQRKKPTDSFHSSRFNHHLFTISLYIIILLQLPLITTISRLSNSNIPNYSPSNSVQRLSYVSGHHSNIGNTPRLVPPTD